MNMSALANDVGNGVVRHGELPLIKLSLGPSSYYGGAGPAML